jgi:acyl-CoA synthetase (AMP-forming)/AMP-acid ligase II
MGRNWKGVRGSQAGETLSADELIAFCQQSLAKYKIPRRIEFSETELPKSGSGKILKRVLRDPCLGSSGTGRRLTWTYI